MHRRYLILLSFIVLAFGCKKETFDPVENSENLQINIHTLLNGIQLEKNKPIKFNDTVQLNLSDLKFYISDITFIKENKGEEKATFTSYDENVWLYRLSDSGNFSLIIPPGNYTTIRFNIGLAPDLNDMNPNQFSAEHPLSRDQDMYWDMMKYRFFVLDGKADYPIAGNFSHVMSYHLGGEEYLRTVELPFIKTISSDTKSEWDIYFDLEKVFTEIDWTVFFSFHSIQDEKVTGLKMMDNISQSFR